MKFIDEEVMRAAVKDPDSPVRAYVPESVEPLTEPLSDTATVSIGEPATQASFTALTTAFPVTTFADCEKFAVTENVVGTLPPPGQANCSVRVPVHFPLKSAVWP